MSNIKPFIFETSEIRVLTDESGENWFVLRDVLSAMGTSVRTNVARADIEQGLGDGYINDTPIVDSLGRNQQATIISEPAVTRMRRKAPSFSYGDIRRDLVCSHSVSANTINLAIEIDRLLASFFRSKNSSGVIRI